jgi:ankyrin repeat protein
MHFKDPASALCVAAGTGDLAQVKRIIENGVDPNVGDYDRRTGKIPCTSRNLGSVSLASAASARRRDLSPPCETTVPPDPAT